MQIEILVVVSEDWKSGERRAMYEMLRAWRGSGVVDAAPRMFTKGNVTARVVARPQDIMGTRPQHVVVGTEVGESMRREAVVRAVRYSAPITHGLDGLRSALDNASVPTLVAL